MADARPSGPAPSSVWIADRGVLSKPAPEYPLMHEGTADVFEGVPGGVSPRGDELLIPVVGNNVVCGGMMGQGKSNACRVIMLGCALDPLAELCGVRVRATTATSTPTRRGWPGTSRASRTARRGRRDS